MPVTGGACDGEADGEDSDGDGDRRRTRSAETAAAGRPAGRTVRASSDARGAACVSGGGEASEAEAGAGLTTAARAAGPSDDGGRAGW